jgi:hypothetical protein
MQIMTDAASIGNYVANVHILLNLIEEYQLSLYVDVSQSGMLVK